MNVWQQIGIALVWLVLFPALGLLLFNVGVYAGLGDWRGSLGGLIAWQIVDDRRPWNE